MSITGVPVLLIPLYYSVGLPLIVLAITALIMALFYKRWIRKAVEDYAAQFPNSSQQLNALINSLNDVIFEFNEEKICLNVWFNERIERAVNPHDTVGKKLAELI